MRKFVYPFSKPVGLLLSWILLSTCAHSQQLSIRDFVLFGGGPNCPVPSQVNSNFPGCGVQIGTSGTVLGGKIGSYKLVKSTGTASFTADIHSAQKIELGNSNTVVGNIFAGTQTPSSNLLFQAGSNFSISQNVYVNGHSSVGGGSLSGFLVHPSGTTYTGPVPAGGEITGTPTIPNMPALPAVTVFPAAGSSTVSTTQGVNPFPATYAGIELNGNKTVTFNGPGTYVFSHIKNTGNGNKFIFDFQNNPSGFIRIYVHNDVDLYKINIEMVNGGSASRIFMEVHGNGSTSPGGNYAWMMTNGASGNNQSIWYGTVWAPFGGINVGSGSSPSKINGALWSGTQVVIDNGVSVSYVMFDGCNLPNANAGTDKTIDCDNPVTQLNGSSQTPNVTYSWSVVNGSFSSNLAQPNVSAGGTYVLTITEPSCGSSATDTVIVTNIPCILPYYPPSNVGKVTTKIGSELTSLNQNFGNVSDSARSIFHLKSDSVLIDVIAYQGQESALRLLLMNTYGMRDTIPNGPGSLITTGWFPVVNLLALNNVPAINHCRPAFPAISNNGIAQTQGDTAMRSHLVRNGYGLTGNNIKVGVLSDSYNTLTGTAAAADVANGDLPGPGNPVNSNPVQVLLDYPYGRRTDEGRAMLQIIHDVAPKAKLAFRTGFLTPGDFAQGIRQLADSACNVIVDDITFITEPFFRQGVVEKSIQAVTANGVSYVTAAGNFGAKSYTGIFQPASGSLPSGLTGKAHDFGGGDIFQNDSLKGSLLTPGIYTIVLQWEDDIYSLGNNTGTVNDLDIYLTDNNGVTLFGFNRNNLGGDPIEVLPFTVTANTATNILIVNSSASSTSTTSNIRFKYVVFRGDLKINEYNQGNSTIVGQGNAVDAITVGAALYSNTPEYGVNPTLASFSSRGGTPVNNVIRNKPDFVGPNGVNTTVNFNSIDYEGDGIPNFFGTSAAAPHVAAAVALMMEANKKYFNQVLSPAAAKTMLKNGAIDMDVPGFDLNTGHGFVNIDSSMRTIANPTPLVISLELEDSSLVPGAQPMDILIHGSYFSIGSVVLFGTDTLQTTVVSNTLATTTIPAFTDNKLVSVYTPPISLLGTDGGVSNSISITGIPKKTITIIADNKSKKYAAVMPAFTTTILVDGDSIQHTQLTPQALGLTNITYTTPANAMSNVGLYVITPVRTFDSSGAVDGALLDLYHYVFTNGVLNISPLPVTVKPKDTTLVYGQKIGDISFDYIFDSTVTIANATVLNNVVSATHQSLLADNVIGLVNNRAVAIVNGVAISITDGTPVTMQDGEMYATLDGTAVPIVNTRAVTIVNGAAAVTIVNSLPDSVTENLSFLVSEASVNNARQITNQVLVNGSLVTQVTNVVDITQESIFEFDEHPSQTELITSVSQTNSRGIVSASALMNGFAVTLIDGGGAVPIVNGSGAVTIVNGIAVTIVDGTAVPIVNSLTSSESKNAVVVDEVDTTTGVNHLQSINMITGLTSGIHSIYAGSLLNDNLIVNYVPGTINILPAPITVKAQDTSKLYGQKIRLDSTRFTITSGRMQYGETIASVTLQSAGADSLANGGNYAIIPSNAVGGGDTDMSNYSITYSNGILSVGKLPLLVSARDTSRLYGDVNPVFKTDYSGFVNGQTFATSGITGSPSLTTTAIATSVIGTYPITVAAGSLSSSNYSFSFDHGVLTVNPSPLTVKAADKVIFQGDPLPNFTGTVSPLKNGDVANYTYNVVGYTTAAGVYPIVPTLVSFPKASSYSITVINGNLYVNPKGAGAKKLRPYLDCVEEVINPVSPSRKYIAHFYCENTNATPVYVPIGNENKITSTGSYDNSQQPVIFMPGTTSFDIPFDGSQLTWELKTYESNKKTSVASNASSTSNKCNSNNSTTGARGVTVSETVSVAKESISVYPNPAKNKVQVISNSGSFDERSFQLFDAVGKSYPVRATRISGQFYELDIASLHQGIYFIRMSIGGELRTVRIIKH